MFKCNGRYRGMVGTIEVGEGAVIFTRDDDAMWSPPKGLVPRNGPEADEGNQLKNGEKISIQAGSMLDVKMEEIPAKDFDIMVSFGNPVAPRNRHNDRKVVILVNPANAPGNPRHEFETIENVKLYNALQDEMAFYAAGKNASQHVEKTTIIREIVKVPCQYCGNLNEITKMRCESCGAPVK
jgi:hypothetical protein